MSKIVIALLALLAVINRSSAAYSVANLGADLRKLNALAAIRGKSRAKSVAAVHVDQSGPTFTPSPTPSHVTPNSSEPVLEVPSGSQHSEFMTWVVAPFCAMFTLCLVGAIRDNE
jgi:hypothetical protein